MKGKNYYHEKKYFHHDNKYFFMKRIRTYLKVGTIAR